MCRFADEAPAPRVAAAAAEEADSAPPPAAEAGSAPPAAASAARGKWRKWQDPARRKKRFAKWKINKKARRAAEPSNTTGFVGVYKNFGSNTNQYESSIPRPGGKEHLGTFATAEEAALVRARALANAPG